MSRIVRRGLQFAGCAAALFISATAILVTVGLHDELGKADVALVLGNTVQADGTPSPRLRARLDRTIELYRAGYFDTIVTSGGRGKEGFDEATVMHDYLVAHNVPGDHVIVDSLGENTYASARETARLLRQYQMHSVLVVSQYFHVPRARLALQRFGVPFVYSAHAHYFEWRDLFSCPRETIGYLSYLARSYEEPPHAGH